MLVVNPVTLKQVSLPVFRPRATFNRRSALPNTCVTSGIGVGKRGGAGGAEAPPPQLQIRRG